MKFAVLVVDDESNVRCSLLRMLQKESYEIVTASSAEDTPLKKTAVDILISDSGIWEHHEFCSLLEMREIAIIATSPSTATCT
jgi:DNA-binding NtrC family response regulator